MAIKLFLAVLCILSGGAFFLEHFKEDKFISSLTIIIAILSTFYLLQDISQDIYDYFNPPVANEESISSIPEVKPFQPEVEAFSSSKIDNSPKQDTVTTPEYDDLKQPPVAIKEITPSVPKVKPFQPEVEPFSSSKIDNSPKKDAVTTPESEIGVVTTSKVGDSLPIVVSKKENSPENAETQIDFTAYFQPKQEPSKQVPPNPKKEKFETTPDFQARRHELLQQFQAQQRKFQARRHKLLQQFNNEVKQRNLDYQAGVLDLTDYNADTKIFRVKLDWQADWVKQFFGKLSNTGKVKIGVKEAKQIYHEEKERPLFITAKLNDDNQVEIQDILIVEKGQIYSIVLIYSHYRYIDYGNGTVTDNRTGLIWLKNANCFGRQNWEKAMQSAANLASGQCGLRDYSKQGMWRLPSKKEWEAMIDKKYVDRKNWSQPALSNATDSGPWKEGNVFVGVQMDRYSSSTTGAYIFTWFVNLASGQFGSAFKTITYYVWPVRDKQK